MTDHNCHNNCHIYNTKHVLSYHGADVFTLEEESILSEKDKHFVRDVLYRHDLLSVLCLEDFHEDHISTCIQKLYDILQNDPIVMKLIVETSNQLFTTDFVLGFMTLFSFDNLCETHLLISNSPYLLQYLSSF